MHSEITISQADPRPMYLQIMEQVRRRIALGDWQPGQEIPSIRALAAEARVSVITVKRAYLELEHAGVLATRQGKGTFVAEDAELSRNLREQELAERLTAAADAGRELGLTAQELAGAAARGGSTAGTSRHGGADMSTAAIELHGVSKRYPFFALDDVSMHLEQGQIMGFVGPNGAGKTTTLRIVMALVRQDAGEVAVLGHPMPAEQVRAKWDVGFVSEEMRLFGRATLAWHLGFVRSIYPGWDEAYARRLLERFNLHPEQRVKGLSRGEHVKALLLLALARRPRLLVLDEPTAGLDPVARHEVISELMEVVRDEERSILFSSHNTVDVEQISDRITFLDRGRIVDADDKEAFLDRWRRLSLDVPHGVELPAPPGVVETSRSGRVAVVTVDRFRPELAAAYSAAGATVREVQRMTLEEIFVAVVVQKRRERAV